VGRGERGEPIGRIQATLSRDVVVAIESNLCEFYGSYGRMPGAKVDSGPDMLRVKTGLPHELLNGIFRAHIPEEDPRAAIDAVLSDFLSERIPVMWWVGPSTEPRNLGTYLESCGLDHAGELSGMAIDLEVLLGHLSPPPELSIEPVRDEDTLRVWLTAFAAGYEMPEAAIRGLFDYFRSVGFGPNPLVRNYLGRWQGEPVASSSLFFGAGVAGVYVTVVPEFRKQGIGAAMTLVPLRVARAAGYRVGVTHVPDYRLGFHRKLGFKPYCTLSTYVPRALARPG